jgi:hypothetical protein
MRVLGSSEWWETALEQSISSLPGPMLVPRQTDSLIEWAKSAASIGAADYGESVLVELAGILPRSSELDPPTWSPDLLLENHTEECAVCVVVAWASPGHTPSSVHSSIVPPLEHWGRQIAYEIALADARDRALDIVIDWLEKTE